jgi:hypothetical protein
VSRARDSEGASLEVELCLGQETVKVHLWKLNRV